MYQFYGQWNPPVDKFIFENYYPEKHNGIGIECGAYDGITESCCYFFEKNFNWKIYNIEPVPNIYSKLIINRPYSFNYNIALSDKDGEQVFKQFVDFQKKDFGNGSLSHHEKHLEDLYRHNCSYYNFLVKTKTYTDFINDENITNLDLFILDVEAHEPQVIKGMIDCDVLPDLFVIEHGHLGNEIIEENLELLKCNYILDKKSFNNSFYLKQSSI